MKKKKLSCESYYWLVHKSAFNREALKDKSVGVLKGSLFVPIFYIMAYFMFVNREIGIPQWGYVIIWLIGAADVVMIGLSLVNLVLSKRGEERVGDRNMVFMLSLIVLGIINLNLFTFLWFYEECWDTNVQYFGIVVWIIGLIYAAIQYSKIKIRLLNGYYEKGREKPTESTYKKILTLLVVSVAPLVLVSGSRRGPLIRDIIGEEYLAVYVFYVSILMGSIISESLSMMFYYIKWHYKYGEEEKENLFADYEGDEKKNR